MSLPTQPGDIEDAAANELSSPAPATTEAAVPDTAASATIQAVPDLEDPETTETREGSNAAALVDDDNTTKTGLALAGLQKQLGDIELALAALASKVDKHNIASRHSEKIIDHLHAELQSHKAGHIRQLLTPLFTQLIRVYDDLSSAVQNLPNRENLTTPQAVQSLATFPADIFELLTSQGLEAFDAALGEPFDPAEQRLIKREPTNDPQADRTVARCIRPGFKWEGRVFRPSFVAVYAYTAPASEPAPPTAPSE